MGLLKYGECHKGRKKCDRTSVIENNYPIESVFMKLGDCGDRTQ
ncbi:hypothetical protein [Nostoc sp. 'Peltigera membranacea cyanobiont' 213]|nr:hypothetical protein [Nostoc sp. 'Peltigera membranacea cyanobiont' 213]